MFAYNPTVNDTSGQILGQGMVGAANTKANAQVKMVDDIGSALVGLAGAYGEMEGNKAKGRAFKDAFKVIAPSAGIDMKQLEALTGGSLKNDMDWYNARETMAPILPSLINAQLVKGNMGIKRDQQALTAALPDIRAGADAEADVAAGKAPYRPANRPRGVIPGAGAAITPMPVISQNPNVFQQARMPFAGMGS